jgi:hypothetical protein
MLGEARCEPTPWRSRYPRRVFAQIAVILCVSTSVVGASNLFGEIDVGGGVRHRLSSHPEAVDAEPPFTDIGVSVAGGIGVWRDSRLAISFRFAALTTTDHQMDRGPGAIVGETTQIYSHLGFGVRYGIAERFWVAGDVGFGVGIWRGRDYDRADQYTRVRPSLPLELRAGVDVLNLGASVLYVSAQTLLYTPPAYGTPLVAGVLSLGFRR